jgi:ribonuclease P protein component
VSCRQHADKASAAFGWDRKLRKTDEFSSVFRFKCLQRGNLLDLYAAPNGLDHPRLGLIVPKRILARAVDRNQIKRILREAFRLMQVGLGGMDVVIRLRAADASGTNRYRAECKRLLEQAQRCKQKPVTE